jgi:NADPH:quinone reductase-like Zn-dependent oxidoreductase/SAM-dependent methyltransferase
MLESVGITPSSVVGHSSGEIAAAYAAGILSQEVALKISYQRSFISSICKRSLPSKGAMIAVGLGEEEVLNFVQKLEKGVAVVACINSPSSTTVSGDEDAILELAEILNEHSIFNRKLNVDTAYHSHHMKKIAAEYLASLEGLVVQPPRSSVTFISSVTAKEKTSDFGAAYWVENLVSPVNYNGALQKFCRLQEATSQAVMIPSAYALIEIGSHNALSGPTRQTITSLKLSSFKHTYVPSLVRNKDAVSTAVGVFGRLFELGYPMKLGAATTIGQVQEKQSVISNLPPYPWDHSTTHWYESRLSKDYRLRKYPHHELLGDRIVTSTSLEPIWRNLIGLDNLPWLREHIVDNFIIFPGAGYLCMAVEAIKQVAQDRQILEKIRTYTMRDISFSKALAIPESPVKTEVQLSLRPFRGGNNKTDTIWEEFRISSLSPEGAWNENCQGLISIDLYQEADNIESPIQERTTETTVQNRPNGLRDFNFQRLDPNSLYQEIESNGNVYGNNFATITELSIKDNEAIAIMQISDIANTMPSGFMQPHIIQPSTLDTILHPSLPLFSRHCGPGAVMPIAIEEIAISGTIGSTPGTELNISTKIFPEGPRYALFETKVFQQGAASRVEPVLTISHGKLRGVGQADTQDEDGSSDRHMSHTLEWKPDVDFLSSDLFMPKDIAVSEPEFSPQQKLDLLNQAACLFFDAAIMKIETNFLAIPKKHHEDLFAWMKRLRNPDANFHDKTEHQLASILAQFGRTGVEGEMLSRMGWNLTPILTGQTDPLTLMLEDDLLYRFYADDSSFRCYEHMAEYLKYLSFKNPSMSILEIGSGTGGATFPLLNALSQYGRLSLASYDFTDISAGFFERARELLREWPNFINYKTLDISKDPASQGFSESTYDLIVAANVLHATKSIDETLANVRKLLKPGGRLILIEVTKLPPYLNTIFGTLPGWWAGVEDGRIDSPLLSQEQWSEALVRASFDGLEVAADDFLVSAQQSTMMVSRAIEKNDTAAISDVLIVPVSASQSIHDFSDDLLSALETCCFEPSIASWPVNPSEGGIKVIIDDGESPSLLNPSSEHFQDVTRLLTAQSQILWISCQRNEKSSLNPEKGLITGLSRAARAENESLRLVTFDIQQSYEHGRQKLLQAISDVFISSFSDHQGIKRSDEFEYSYRDDQLLIPRVIPNDSIDTWISDATLPPKTGTSLFHLPERPLKLEVERPGLLNSIRYVDDDSVIGELASDELEVITKAFSVGERDVSIALGQKRPSVKMVAESAGIIDAVGSNFKDQFQIGDRVSVLGGTPFASRIRVNGNLVQRPPDFISLTDGSLGAFVAAYYAMIEIARLEKGQRVLINAAAGAIGTAAIMVALNFGAEIFANVDNATEKERLIANYSIPEANIFMQNVKTFKKDLLLETRGVGVDVIFNTVSGELFHESWECIAKYGTFIEVGTSNTNNKNQISMRPFEKNVSFISFDLASLVTDRPEKVSHILGTIMKLFQNKAFVPIEPIATMDIGKIEDAFRMVHGVASSGKIVLTANENTTVKALDPPHPHLCLDENATYVVAGGMGDLGTRICHLLVTRGAKHVLILSRRTPSQDLLDSLSQEFDGAKVYMATCDIGDISSIESVASQHQGDEMPPVCGVIQAAMVLQVSWLDVCVG